MSHVPIRWHWMLACSLLAVVSSAVRAQETIKWRTSYQEARKEAEAKNLPLFIDFVQPNCFFCDKMDQSTFRDPRVLRLLNEKFVPLKINRLEQAQLAADLQINAAPTLVTADPDGRNAKFLVGFQEADIMHEHLLRLVMRLTPTDTVQKEFQNAQTWESTGDYGRAIATLRNILIDTKGGQTQKNAQALLEKIEKRAADNLVHARELQTKGQIAEAVEFLGETQRQFAGLQASKDAGDMIARIEQANVELRAAQRTKRVQELLTQAHDFYKSKDYIPCLDRCELILTNYGDLPEGQRAFALAGQIKNNREWLQNGCDVMMDRLAGMWLALADSHLKHSEVRQAELVLRKVIQAFPGTRFAESAQIRLTQIQATMQAPEVRRSDP